MTPYAEPCPNCDGYVEARTLANVHVLDLEHAYLGDLLQCTLCECWALVTIQDGKKCADWSDPCGECLRHRIQTMVETLRNYLMVEYAIASLEE